MCIIKRKNPPGLVLPAEGAPLSQPGLTTSGLAQDGGTRSTKDYCLGVREDSGDRKATWALDVHEVRVGALYETLELVAPLLGLSGGVKQINGESHIFELGATNECVEG